MILLFPAVSKAAEITHVKWDNLSMVNGHIVRIFLPQGSIVGKATAVEADALVVRVQSTSSPNWYPKGQLRIPRERLHRLEIQKRGILFRVLFAPPAIMAGSAAALAIDYNSPNDVLSAAAFAGCITAGYLAGRVADKHWAAIEILP